MSVRRAFSMSQENPPYHISNNSSGEYLKDNSRALRRQSLLSIEGNLPPDERGYSIDHNQNRIAKLSSGFKLSDMFPIIAQLQDYPTATFFLDFRAALTTAFVILPQAVAFSSLAGISPQNSILSAVWPLLVYGILGASRSLSVGPEAVTAVLAGVSVRREVAEHGGDPNEIASALALLVGILCIFLAILDAGFIDNILAGHLLLGFITGAAILIVVEQLPELFGIRIAEAGENLSTFNKILEVMSPENSLHIPTLILGLSCLTLLYSLKFLKAKFKKQYPVVALIPEVLILVSVSIAFSATLSFSSKGIHVLSPFQNGILPPRVPVLNADRAGRLFSDAITILIAGYLESQAFTRQTTAKAFPSGDRELFALGSANIIGSFFGTFNTFGSLARSTIKKNAGAQTNLAGIMVASFVLVLFLAFTSVLKFLPKATLAAIVFSAAMDLIEFDHILFVFKMRSPEEIIFATAVFFMVFFVSIGRGILLSVLFASFVILRRATKLNISLLGEVKYERDGVIQRKFVDISEDFDAQLVDNVLMLSVKGPLEFYNAGRLRRRIEMFLDVEGQIRLTDPSTGFSNKTNGRLFVAASQKPPTGYTIVLDMRQCENLDNSSVFLLEEIIHAFKENDVRFIICGANEIYLEMFRKAGLDKLLGKNLVENMDMALLRAQSTSKEKGFH